MPRIAILLPPSEGKAPGGSGPPWAPGTGVLGALDGDRRRVLGAVDRGIGGAPTLPAIERYRGVLYQELDWASLPAGAKRRGRASVLIFSGLWGAVGPADPIPEYKLKMSASLPDLGRLASWWKPRLTAALAEHLRGAVVWDLLPQEHAAAWDPSSVPLRRRYTVRFLDVEGRTVSHWNKLLKGALVREILTAGLADAGALAAWEHPLGYRLDPGGDTHALAFRQASFA